MAASTRASRKTAAKKAAKTRKGRATAKKAAKTRHGRTAAKKVAKTRKARSAASKAAAPPRSRTDAAKPAVSSSAAVAAANSAKAAELDARIAILRNNLRMLVEQAASVTGASSEELLSQRIAEQEAKLEVLRKQREEL